MDISILIFVIGVKGMVNRVDKIFNGFVEIVIFLSDVICLFNLNAFKFPPSYCINFFISFFERSFVVEAALAAAFEAAS